MNRPRLIQHMRIATSAICGILCLLLVVLWVRSYFNRDIITLGLASGPGFYTESVNGSVAMAYFRYRTGYVSKGSDAWSQAPDGTVVSKFKTSEFLGFHFKAFGTDMFVAAVPLWFPVVFSAVLTVAPWIRRTFSLRTLLIVTTLIAVVLGTVAFFKHMSHRAPKLPARSIPNLSTAGFPAHSGITADLPHKNAAPHVHGFLPLQRRYHRR